MAVLKLPFTDSSAADAHEEGLFQCGLFRMLPEPVQEVTRESVHLLEYMHMVPIEEMGIPEYYPELTRKLGDLKEPNLIYPVGQGIFTHIFPNNDSGRNTYISVEPLLTSNVIDLSREVERKLLDFTDELGDVETDEDRTRALIGILDRICTSKGTGKSRGGLFGGIFGKDGGTIRVGPRDLDALKYVIVRDKIGLGILEPMMGDTYIEDISCSGVGCIYVEHKIFKGLETAITFTDFEELDEFVLRLAERIKKPVTALSQTFRSLLSTLVASQFFWAIYVAIATGVVAIRAKPIATLLEKGVSGVEHAGQYLQPLIPAFMFAVGVYVQALPSQLNGQIGLEATATSFQTVEILGLSMDANTTAGMVMIYVVGALLVGVAASVWHVAILALAKLRDPRFSLRNYFTNYWVKAYPLLWSTSSESLATPLNLYILSKRAPYVKPTVRRLVAGAGSVLCTNGTLISVFILLGIVAAILGIRLSLLELLLCIPVAFLISFGIPGIPGELLLFAGPLAVILAIAPEVTPLFLALYLGLQIGLPDSFRTGANSTNNFVYCILLNKTYEDRFMPVEPSAEELEG